MKLQGEHRFDAPRETVWQAIQDPEVLARVMPGCEKLERSAENEFKGVLNVQVGPVKGAFQGKLELSDVRPLEGYHMKVNGQGPSGFMRGQGSLMLADAEGGTLLTYDVDAQVGGRVAGVGQRLLDSSAKVIAQQGLEGLEAQLVAMTAPAARGGGEAEAAAPPAPPTQTQFATRFAKGLFNELVPAPYRGLVIGGGIVILLLLLFPLIRACAGG